MPAGNLTQACEAGRVFGMRPIILQAQAAAVDGLVAAGRLDSAESERTSALVIAAEIANQISDRELRSVYLEHTLSLIH